MKDSMDHWLNQFPPDRDVVKEKIRLENQRIPVSGPGRKTLEKMDVELTLDIHGMTQAEARIEILNFLKICRKKRIKKGLIIHGIGKHSSGKAVLKPMVTDFLRDSPEIAEYGTAKKKDGGLGASWFSLTISPGK